MNKTLEELVKEFVDLLHIRRLMPEQQIAGLSSKVSVYEDQIVGLSAHFPRWLEILKPQSAMPKIFFPAQRGI